MKFSVRSVFANATVIGSGSVAAALLGLLQSVVLARGLGPAGFGVWAVVLAYVAFVRGVLSFRMSEPLTRWLVDLRHRGDREQVQQLLSVAVLIEASMAVFSCAVILLSSYFLAAQLAGGDAHLAAYWTYGVSVLFSCADGIWYSVARDQRDFRAIAVYPVVLAAIKVVGVAVLQVAGILTVASVAVWMTASAAIGFAMLAAYLFVRTRRVYGVHIVLPRWDVLRGSEWFREGFWPFLKSLYWSGTLSTVGKNADVLILGYFRPAHEVGLYRLAKSLVAAIQVAVQSLGSVLYQDVNELLRQGQRQQVFSALRRFMPMWLTVIVAIWAATVAFAESAIVLGFGDVYREAWLLLVVVMVGAGTMLLFFWAQPIVLALDGHSQYLKIVGFATVSAALGYTVGARECGAMGVAIAVAMMWVLIYGGFAWLAIRLLRAESVAEKQRSEA